MAEEEKTEETTEEEFLETPSPEDFEEESEQTTREETPEETLEESPVETRAREMGWVPQEDFKGDPEAWVDAKEFVGRAPLFEAIHKSNRENKKLRQEMEQVKDFQKKLYDKAKSDALADLHKKYEEAAESNDIKAAMEIRDKIKETERETPDKTKEINKKIYDTWVNDNKWYEDDEDMNVLATAYGTKLAQDNPEIEYETLLDNVSKKMREKFPEKFEKPSTKRSAAVSRPSTSSQQTNGAKDPKKITIHQLPEDVKPVYRTMVKSNKNPGGPLEHDDFIKQYLDIGGELIK